MRDNLHSAFVHALPTGQRPYAYQLEVGQRLLEGRNLVLRAPTGCGKSLAALVPFILGRQAGRYSRMIYALPLRTLARSILSEAERVVAALGAELTVKMQTGEQPDDPFFALGDIVVCTYDQLLSGLLAAPYGLPGKLANINAACVTGALVVFDEFHLMAADKAFLTGTACLAQFGALTQSLWMSATATEPLLWELASGLQAQCIELPEADWQAVPSVSRVRRTVQWRSRPLTAGDIDEHRGKRVVVICNRVDWARELFERIPNSPAWPVKLLHSRFFRADRERKEDWLRRRFGKDSCEPGLLICTQVIEAGIDITSDILLTHHAPMNALVQRAGRCARFPPSAEDGSFTTGQVQVFELTDEDSAALPYEEGDLSRAREILQREAKQPTAMDPAQAHRWVQMAHQDADEHALGRGWLNRAEEARQRIAANVFSRRKTSVSDLIREVDDNVRVYLSNAPPERPSLREPLSLSRWTLSKFVKRGAVAGWAYLPRDREMAWEHLTPDNLDYSYFVTLQLGGAKYTPEAGLVLGEPGETASPERDPPRPPGHGTLQVESWIGHTASVASESEARARREVPGASAAAAALPVVCGGVDLCAYIQAARFCAALHDFGKLQGPWQRWAIKYERDRDPESAPPAPMAHTQYRSRDPADEERQRRVNAAVGPRPAHAAQSGYYAACVAGEALTLVTDEEVRAKLASACCAAITSHHGGWVPDLDRFYCHSLWDGWRAVGSFLAEHHIRDDALAEAELETHKRAPLVGLLRETTDHDVLRNHWPLVALLMRVLRLSDQKATAEGSGEVADG